MTIELQDALERAQLMADDDGLLSQQAYELLVNKLEDEDLHAFSMALLDFGVSVKSASREDSLSFREAVSFNRSADIQQERLETIDYLSSMVRVAQSFVQSPGGLWVPDDYVDDEGYYPLEDEDLEEVGGPSQNGQYDTSSIKQIRKVLENAGLAIGNDGKVYFYQSSIPGIYTQKLPQNMTLEQTVDYFEQVLDMTDKQQSKVDGLLDSLSSLTSQVYEMENTLEGLKDLKFNVNSKNPQIRDIGLGLEAVQQYVAQGDWNGVQASLDELKSIVDQYYGKQYDEYDRLLEIVDALDKIEQMKETDSEAFYDVTQGLGAVAARKAQDLNESYDRKHNRPAKDNQFTRYITIKIDEEKLIEEVTELAGEGFDFDINPKRLEDELKRHLSKRDDSNRKYSIEVELGSFDEAIEIEAEDRYHPYSSFSPYDEDKSVDDRGLEDDIIDYIVSNI